MDLPAALVNGRPTYEWWNAQRVSKSETLLRQVDMLAVPAGGLSALGVGYIPL